jgi:Mn2+/Fe2+ NRAMP family transporter
MAGRFAAVSHHTISDAIRERFGFNFFLWPLLIVFFVNLLVLAAEIGGAAIALELATGIGFQVWAMPVALLTWLLLWKGTFGFIEKGVSILGLVTLCFIVAAVLMNPDWKHVASATLPARARHSCFDAMRRHSKDPHSHAGQGMKRSLFAILIQRPRPLEVMLHGRKRLASPVL